MKLKRMAKTASLMMAGAFVVGAVLYATGLRIVLDGGGGLHFAFSQSAGKRADDIAKHREAQKAKAEGAVVAPARASIHWTDFRGPARDGRYQQEPIRTDWSPNLKLLWKQPVGGGYASFTIARGRAFTIEQRADQEVAAAYDITTGRELWTTSWNALFTESMGGDGPRATPTWHDGRVYVLGATGELRALDEASGKTLWRTEILEDAGAENIQWGMSGSPLIVDDTVVVLPGGGNDNSVVAYDLNTGKRRWGVLGDRASYSSPMFVTLAGVRQILAFTATRLVALTRQG